MAVGECLQLTFFSADINSVKFHIIGNVKSSLVAPPKNNFCLNISAE